MPEVQHASNTATFTSGTSGAVTVTISAAGAGNCLIACVNAVGSAGTPSILGVKTGSDADNWVKGVEVDDPDNTACSGIWVDLGTTGGGTSVVVTVAFGATASAANSCTVFVDVFEFSGVTEVDQTSASNEGGDSESWSSGATGTTTEATEIAVGTMNVTDDSGGTLTVTGPAWSNQSVLSGTVEFDSSPFHCYGLSGYLLLSTEQTVTWEGTLSASGFWDAVVLTLKTVIPPVTNSSINDLLFLS